jgi:hypothetical protein
MGKEDARILARFDADGGGVGLAEEGVEGDRGLLMRLVVAVAEQLTHRSLP